MDRSDGYKVQIDKKSGLISHDEKFEDKKTVNVPYTMKLLIQELESMAIATRLITEENVNSQVFNTMKKDISKYSIENDISDDIDENDEGQED